MRLEGTREIDAPPAAVWTVVDDPPRVARLVPGVESVEALGPDRWRAAVGLLGLGLPFRIDVEREEEVPRERVRLRARGGALGTGLTVDARFRLAAEGGGTELHWEADVELRGLLSRLGEGVVRAAAEREVRVLLEAIEREVRAEQVSGRPPD